MIDLGVVRPGKTIRIPFSSFDKDDGSSITMTAYVAADILVYKDGSATERASTAGYTATTDFDAKTGKHFAIIDLADNTTAGFFAAGSEYHVAIDAVTVDAVTVGGWIARFEIGYAGSMLDTTIATLASQTSFTLTSGPAENDALKDMWCIIHDVASAVQCGKAVISAYTGATKTVTLAAGTTFTAAAGDNISIMGPMPVQATTAGRTLDVSTGGEAGIDWANIGSPTTAVNLSATNIDVDQVVASVTGAVGSVTGLTPATVHSDLDDIQARLPAALVGGRMDASVGAMAANVITATAIAADAITDAKVAADVTIASVTGAVGSVTAGVTVTTNNDKTGYGLSAAAVQAVWDALTSALTTAGSIGKKLADWVIGTTQTGDSFARLGAPAGASVSADIAAIKAETATILGDTNDIQTRIPAALVGGRMDSNASAIDNVNTAAVRLARSTQGIVTGTVGAASTTTSIVTSALAPAAAVIDQFKGRIVTFDQATTTANLRGQSTDITANTALGVLTVTALTTAPVSGDTFTIT